MILRALLVVAAVGHASAAAAQPCDPYSRETPVAIPPTLTLERQCGNGRIDEYATSCVLHETGGCNQSPTRATECTKVREVCDGRAVGGNSCRSLGYASGTLRCASTCTDFDFSTCAICPAGTACTERRITEDERAELALFGQGTTVRAFWNHGGRLAFADVDRSAKLGAEHDLGAADRAVHPIQVGTSVFAILGGHAADRHTLAIVAANGSTTVVDLPPGVISASGLRSIVGHPWALVLVGELAATARVLVLDEDGKAQPLTALYARGGSVRDAIVPLAKGTHRIEVANVAGEVTSEDGDLLYLHRDGSTFAFLIRRGMTDDAFTHTAKQVPGRSGDAPDVIVDGHTVASFHPEADVVLGVTRAAPRPEKLQPMFGALVYEDPASVAVARTPTLEVQAAVFDAPVNRSAQYTRIVSFAIAVRNRRSD